MSLYWRLSNLYFWFFALLGALLPYWSLYLQDQGFSYLEIALLMGALQATKIFAPNLWGWLGDRWGRRLTLVRVGAGLAALIFLGVLVHPGFYPLLAIMLGFSFFWNAVLPLYEVITLRGLERQRARYGRVRLWGSIGFILAVSLLGFLFEFLPVAALPWLLLMPFAGILVSTWLVPDRPSPPAGDQTAALGALLRQGPVLSFFIVNILLQLSFGSYYTFFSIHLKQFGYGDWLVGCLWALGVVAEVVLFLVMHSLFERYSLRRIALISLALTALRWVLIARFSGFVWVLVFAQLLHAASYGALHAMSVQFIQLHFGERHQGKGQALYSGLSFGLGGALGAWGAGLLVDWRGTGAAFAGSALIMVLAIFVAYAWLRPAPARAFVR